MRMTHDQMLAVIQAQKEGKPREARRIIALTNAEWFPISPNVNCNFLEYEYRIAPPTSREGYVHVRNLHAEPGLTIPSHWLRVREIVEREGT